MTPPPDPHPAANPSSYFLFPGKVSGSTLYVRRAIEREKAGLAYPLIMELYYAVEWPSEDGIFVPPVHRWERVSYVPRDFVLCLRSFISPRFLRPDDLTLKRLARDFQYDFSVKDHADAFNFYLTEWPP